MHYKLIWTLMGIIGFHTFNDSRSCQCFLNLIFPGNKSQTLKAGLARYMMLSNWVMLLGKSFWRNPISYFMVQASMVQYQYYNKMPLFMEIHIITQVHLKHVQYLLVLQSHKSKKTAPLHILYAEFFIRKFRKCLRMFAI